ncbi:MAG: L-histidine N(alpha)-methyltransferase [Bacteroidetes bacterium]|nr:L-histidine N(alpha)-methyltransferase [Bacteroidota bacterium]
MTEGALNPMENFAEDVRHGLSSNPKRLMSRYLYDDSGTRIFREIAEMPDYYLTPSERKIFQVHAEEMASQISGEELEIIEFGVGDGSKTYYLLKALQAVGKKIRYVPVDVSREALTFLISNLPKRLKNIEIESYNQEYFSALEKLEQQDSRTKRLVLFLGSNIGNFNYQGALAFLKQLHRALNPGDQAIIGVDLKKAPAVILPAYADSKGICSRFHLNLLKRMNTELGAHFNLKNFKHYSSYQPESGEVHNFLISQKEQEVLIEKLNRSIHFNHLEAICTETSKKYSKEEFLLLIKNAGFYCQESYFDGHLYFMNVLLEKRL